MLAAIGYSPLQVIVIVIVIVISKLLKRYSKAKRTRAPAYSRTLRRIKGGFPKGGSREAQVRFPEYQKETSQVNFRLMAEYNISVSRLTKLHSRFTSNGVIEY